MGLLEFLGIRNGGGDHHLVVVTYEGPNRLRLNANRTSSLKSKRGAAAHDQTVGWVEFDQAGVRLDQGTGPCAGKLGEAAVKKLLGELHLSPACRSVLHELTQGREQASKILSFEKWGHFGVGHEDAPEGGGTQH